MLQTRYRAHTAEHFEKAQYISMCVCVCVWVCVQGEARKAMTARSQTIARSVAAMRQGVLPAAAQASDASGSKRARTSQETGGLDPALRQFLTG